MSHVSGWLTSVEVFAAIPELACLAFCRVASGDILWPVRSDSGGRRVLGARLVFWVSGASGMGANAVDRKWTFFWCFQNKK